MLCTKDQVNERVFIRRRIRSSVNDVFRLVLLLLMKSTKGRLPFCESSEGTLLQIEKKIK